MTDKEIKEAINDVIDYAKRYGYDALGYAIEDMCKRRELDPMINSIACGIWEYGGNKVD